MSMSKMEKVDCIKEILTKYSAAEEQLDRKLDRIKQIELQTAKEHSACSSPEPYKLPSLEEAKLRNSNLLKSLEISKARLRSRSTFSPVEQILQQAIDNYRKQPALVLQSPSRHPASNVSRH